jgi:hypothetical protein
LESHVYHKQLVIAMIALSLGVVAKGAEPPTATVGSIPVAQIVTSAEIAIAVAQLSPQLTDDEPLCVLDAGPNRLGAFVVGRPKITGPTRVFPDGTVPVTEGLQLDQVSAVLQVLNGAGEFVVGGTLVNPVQMAANDPDASVIGPGRRGNAILGGARRRITRGDIVIIPAGVPHGFASIETPISYLVVRVDSGRSLPLTSMNVPAP